MSLGGLSQGTPPFGWAVAGPGRIAQRFAQAVQALPNARIAAVWGRDLARAQGFARQWQGDAPAPAPAHEQLADLLADPAVDAVYIATPHDSHAALTLACLDAGKPVLCEKPLTPTAAQTRAVTARAQARGVTLVEALWTAYLPLYMQIKQWLQEGEIGELRVIESSFCFDVPYQPESRLFDPQRAGGALLDIGIYNLAVTRLAMAAAFGHCPEPTTLQAHGLRTRSGVDQCVQGLLHFPTGSSARFICAFDRRSANACRLRGSRGEILVPQDFWQATRATLRRPGRPPLTVERPWAVNGFEYEVADTMHCVRTGRLQSAVMPHAESLALVRWLDALRRHMGVRYPFE